jgi:hypothetical protein
MNQETDADASAFDLSTTHLKHQVLDVILAEDSSTIQWLNLLSSTPKVQTAPSYPLPPPRAAGSVADQIMNLGTLDPDLAMLPSPNRIPNAATNAKHLDVIISPCFLTLPSGSSAGLPPSSPSPA